MTQKKILLIHSGLTEGNGTKRHLEESGYLVVPAGSGVTGLNSVKDCCFDLILLDVIFPDTEGLDLCRRFRERDDTRSIPIILIVGRGYSPDNSLPKSLGPNDYLVKPFTHEELDEKISALLRLNTATTTPRPAPEPAPAPGASPHTTAPRDMQPGAEPPTPRTTKGGVVRYLRPAAKPETAAAPKPDGPGPPPVLPFPWKGDVVIDPVTGLFGRSQFEAMFSKEFKRAVRFKQQMSCILIGLEGQDPEHKADETMVKSIIGLVQKTIREVDTAAWWSGESFIILLPNTIRNDALQAAARILEAVANQELTWPDSTKVVMNIGVAGLPDKNIDTEKKLIDAAIAACRRAGELMVPSPAQADALHPNYQEDRSLTLSSLLREVAVLKR